MANVVTVENVDVAKVLSVKEAEDLKVEIEGIMNADPVTQQLMKAAETVEDVYEVVKRFLKITMEDFKIIFGKTVEYFKGEKAALPDEVMDTVVGGGWWSDFWNEHKVNVTIGAIIVGGALAGAAIGGLIGGGPGALALGLLGLGVSGFAALAYVVYGT